MGIRTRDYLSALCRCNRTVVLLALALTLLLASTGRATTLVDEYLERHFETFPTAATAAGRHDLDHRLEDFGEAERRAWLEYNQAAALRIRDRLTMATINGARALGMQDELGSIEPGKWADLIAVDMVQPETQPLYHPISQLVYAADAAQVTHSWVAGKPLMKNRELVHLDIEDVLARAARWAHRIGQVKQP